MRTSKTVLATAAYAALRQLSERSRDAIGQWAKSIDEEIVPWSQFEASLGGTEQERAAALQKLWEAELGRKAEEERRVAAKRA